jgi:hypothetical protein
MAITLGGSLSGQLPRLAAAAQTPKRQQPPPTLHLTRIGKNQIEP